MQNIKEKIRFTVSALLYFMFNMRIDFGSALPVDPSFMEIMQSVDLQSTIKASAWQILETAPFVAGLTYLIVSVLQYMGDGSKLPWDRKLRLFFAIGIIAGLILGIWEYGGVTFN
jgi:hypothetical protein